MSMAGQENPIQTQTVLGADVWCLQKSRVREQLHLPSTASTVEPRSKTSKREPWSPGAGAGCLQQQRAAGAELTWQHQDVLQRDPWLSAQGLILPYEIPQPCRAPGMQLGAESLSARRQQQSAATLWAPSSNDLGIPVGGESWSLFQTSCAASDNMWLCFAGACGHFTSRAESGWQNSKVFVSLTSGFMSFTHQRHF